MSTDTANFLAELSPHFPHEVTFQAELAQYWFQGEPGRSSVLGLGSVTGLSKVAPCFPHTQTITHKLTRCSTNFLAR